MATNLLLLQLLISVTGVGPNRTIEGVVLDSSGDPVSGATVLVAHTVRAAMRYISPTSYYCTENPQDDESFLIIGSGEKAASESTTDRKGRFSFGRLRQGKYSLLAFHSVKGIAQLAETEASESPKRIEIRFDPPTFIEGRVHGYVPRKPASWFARAKRDELKLVYVDDPGLYGRSPRSIYGGPIVMHSESVHVESDGRFRLGPLLVGGNYAAQLMRWNTAHMQYTCLLIRVVDVAPGKTTHVDIHLDEGVRIKGQVVDETGEALAKVRVQLVPETSALKADVNLSGLELAEVVCKSEEGTYLYGMEADDKGMFEVRGVPPGKYTLFVDRMYEKSQAAKMGVACEIPMTEFFMRRSLTVGDSAPDFLKLTVTQADRDRATVVDEQRQAAERKQQEEIAARAQKAATAAKQPSPGTP